MAETKHVIPPHVDQAARKARADKRRAALVAAGCQTYEIGSLPGSGQVAILCMCCGVGIRIDLDDGSSVVAETSLRNFLVAADALRARYGGEV
jgi:hypothetical protein